MYKIRVSFKQKDLNVFEKLRNYSSSKNDNISKNLKLKKCLVFSKFSRYDYERYFLSKSPQNDLEFEKKVRSKGLNYDRLVEYKTMNSKFEEKVTNCLKELGIEVQVVNRLSCNTKLIEWADIIIPTGGDGTFLLAASQITDNKKIIVGFNSDPNHSEGHLCLPKKFSVNIKEAIKNLQTGNFRWLMRSRIRTKLTAQTFGKPVDLHRMNNDNLLKFNPENGTEVTLPVLALNEVFVGESLSAKASTLDINLDDSTVFTRIKSSGVCITTGTGSTSWYYSMNRLAPDYISILLRLLKSKIDNPELLENNNSLCSELADIYNKSLIFNADDKRMAYTVRDMIVAGVWPSPKGIQPRNFAKKVRLQSLCYDAGLVIDGNISFPFNNNAKATFEIHDEDALRTVIMNP